jgi:acetoin utilization deacetylase AcuC-like enzyme/GNAT superfamily N-acetyltransferase
MFRVRRIHDDATKANQTAIAEVQQILAEQFPGVAPDEIAAIPEHLRNPVAYSFRTVVYVALNGRDRIIGFALMMHDPVLNFAFLDYISARKGKTGGGIGAALYEHVRDEARNLGAKGLFFECAQDSPKSLPDNVRRQNSARLRFYERYGARPVIGTAYETPVPGATSQLAPHLMYDDLDSGQPLSAEFARKVVRAILERKYGEVCPPDYVDAVVESFRDDPVRLRDYRYLASDAMRRQFAPHQRIALFVNRGHEIHHVHERGYVESPVRVRAISTELQTMGCFVPQPAKNFSEEHLLAVHDADFVDYLRRVCQGVPPGKSIYPYVFPIRNAARPPRDLAVQAGYYCIDTFTPINQNAWPAAIGAVDCALSAAQAILEGRPMAYALVRPPGHHAERRVFGGFCYFNNAAVAAQFLCAHGKVAILDIDYHHGNGQQDIFFRRSDVLTVSLHGDPVFAYPYFTGFADEAGELEGHGFNLNVPLPEALDGPSYRRALAPAIQRIVEFNPAFLIVALGLDTAKGDPTGTWSLTAHDFSENGRLIGRLRLPTLIVQEGGYRTRTIGINARHFFWGLLQGSRAAG